MKIMSNDLILKREIKIESWNIQCELAEATKRPDILVVLQYLSEQREYGTAKGLAAELLFDEIGRERVAKRLLDIVSIYGLAVSERGRYHLTEKGLSALQDKSVFVPKSGVWQVVLGDDSLLPHSIIQYSEFPEPKASDEAMWRHKDKTDERMKNMKKTPDLMRKYVQKKLLPYLHKNEVVFHSVETKSEKTDSKLKLTIEWNVTKNTIVLKKESDIIFQDNAPDLTVAEVWDALLQQEGLLEFWDGENLRLNIDFDSAKKSNALESMQKTIVCKAPNVDQYGKFNSVTANNIKIYPNTQEDMKRWAYWRLDHQVKSYPSVSDWNAWVEHAVKVFDDPQMVDMPNRDEYAHDLWQQEGGKTDKVWYAMAATDWDL